MMTVSQLFESIFTGLLMNKNYFDVGSRYSTRRCALFLACLLPAVVFAGTPQATQQRNNEALMPPVETAAVAISLDQGINRVMLASKDDAVIVQDGETLPTSLISVAFVPSDNHLRFRQGSATTDAAQEATSDTESEKTSRIPYSLALALFALIWLVPVSRHNR